MIFNSSELIKVNTSNETLNLGIQKTVSYLENFASDPGFAENLQLAFGNRLDVAHASSILEDWLEQKSDRLPKIEIKSNHLLNGAKGAYSATTNTIYLAEEFLQENATDIDTVASVILEELGHAIDTYVNIQDAPGDEGAIFAGLVTEGSITTEELASLQAEYDKATILLNKREISIEQANDNALTLTGGTAQIAYVAYYGRPADPGGLSFWNQELTNNGVSYAPQTGDTLVGNNKNIYDRIVNEFGNSEEANRLFGEMNNNRDKVNQVYRFAFGRDGDAEGLNYWAEQIDKGNVTLATFALEVALGARGEDINVLNNKIQVADSLSQSIDTQEELNAYSGSSGEVLGRQLLDYYSTATSSQDSLLSSSTNPLPTPTNPYLGGDFIGSELEFAAAVDAWLWEESMKLAKMTPDGQLPPGIGGQNLINALQGVTDATDDYIKQQDINAQIVDTSIENFNTGAILGVGDFQRPDGTTISGVSTYFPFNYYDSNSGQVLNSFFPVDNPFSVGLEPLTPLP